MTSTLPQASSPSPSIEVLTFAELVSLMWQRRRLVIAGFLIGLLLAILYIALAAPLYRSQGVFNLQYIGFAEYKRYSPALADRERFLDYAARRNQFSASELDRIRSSIRGAEALNRWVHPLFTITKTDVKEVAETPKDANQFTGVDIDVSSHSAEFARKLVVALGEYVRDFVMEGKVYDLVLPSITTFSSELTRKELDIVRANFELQQLERRKNELTVIANRYPGASREAQRQVISTQDGGERYLSPVTQVIGVEAQMVETNTDLAAMAREKERLQVLIDFYKQARELIAKVKTGGQLAALDQAFDGLQKRAQPSDAARDAIGTIRVELDQLRALNTDYMRFAGEPSAQSQFGSILVWSPVVLGPLMGLLIAILLAIALEWWFRNATAVVRSRS
jgi:hypothetical protein